jgi:hypothetical protein
MRHALSYALIARADRHMTLTHAVFTPPDLPWLMGRVPLTGQWIYRLKNLTRIGGKCYVQIMNNALPRLDFKDGEGIAVSQRRW